MAYRAFRNAQDQADAEAIAPERFDDGAGWAELARRALTLGHTRSYTPDEWSTLTGTDPRHLPANVTASAAWSLLPEYTTQRLAGRWVTLQGIADHLDPLRAELYALAPTLRNPAAIRGARLAIYLIDQADTDPDKRATWVRLAQANDLLNVAMYRPAAPITTRTLPDLVNALRPGTCLPITEAQRLEYARSPIPNTYLARYTYPRPGGYQICRGAPSRVGFGTAW